MDRHSHVGFMCLVVVAQALVQVPAARGQQGYPPGYRVPLAARSDQPDAIVLSVIRANPLTAPYAITAAWRNGTVVLAGRVGTSVIHDMAVRTVIDLGYPVRDDLVIDTAEAHRVALAQAVGGPWSSPAAGSLVGSAPYFVYPPPLFGRLDDPFFGFEPPLVSFPPWATSGNPDSRVRQPSMAPGTVPGAPGPGAIGFPEVSGTAQRQPVPPEQAPIKGNLQLTVDMAGQVHLSGVVASELDKQVIEDEARNTPGVSQVFSELRVATQTQPTSETPSPPPQPVLRPDVQEKPNPPHPEVIPQPVRPEPKAALAPRSEPEPRKTVTPDLAMARDGQRLTRRVADSLARRAPLAGLPISVQSRGDVVTLAGKVPSAYEAMLAYRTVEQTPGVREIVDQLQFQVPDENHPNPLRQKGRPEDLEPYLTSQIRRHVGELAHVDRVRVRGDILEIQGTLPDGEDPNRLQAILRSMPLLRDFRLEPIFHPE
ncbi:MAG: BON domain-containing protein [Isosphaeraceae bacterium]